MILISGMYSKAVRVLNSAHSSSDPCAHLYANSTDDISDPSSVSVLATEDKNRQDSSHSSCQGAPWLEK